MENSLVLPLRLIKNRLEIVRISSGGALDLLDCCTGPKVQQDGSQKCTEKVFLGEVTFSSAGTLGLADWHTDLTKYSFQTGSWMFQHGIFSFFSLPVGSLCHDSIKLPHLGGSMTALLLFNAAKAHLMEGLSQQIRVDDTSTLKININLSRL